MQKDALTRTSKSPEVWVKSWDLGPLKIQKLTFSWKKNSFWFLNRIFLTYSEDVQSLHTFLMIFYTNLSKNNIYFIFILHKEDLKTHFQSSADSIWVDQRISSPYLWRIGSFLLCLLLFLWSQVWHVWCCVPS